MCSFFFIDDSNITAKYVVNDTTQATAVLVLGQLVLQLYRTYEEV